MVDPTKTIAEAYTRQVLFEQWAMSTVGYIVEALEEYEDETGEELTEEEIKTVVESFLTESYK
jgi:hypothetical protein